MQLEDEYIEYREYKLKFLIALMGRTSMGIKFHSWEMNKF
jgi:hypothetical protein